MKIVVDPGHGGSKTGAVGPAGTKEKDLNLAISRVLHSVLNMEGVETLLTRNSDIDVSLFSRVTSANDVNADLFVSIHCNASVYEPANGMEIYTSRGNTKSDILAESLQEYMLRGFPTHNDFSEIGPSEDNFYVLRKTSMPAILVECEFISNKKMERFLLEEYVEIGKRLGCGIFSYYYPEMVEKFKKEIQ